MRGHVVALTLSAVLSIQAATEARADLLVPTDFTSLGAFPTASGNYTYAVSGGVATITGAGGTWYGTVYQDSPGHSLAVFDFDSINLTSGQTLSAVTNTSGQLPLVLLSRGDATIAGTISVSSFGPNGSAGGFAAGSGPGAGSSGPSVFFPPSLGPGAEIGGSGGGGFGGSGSAGASGDTGFAGKVAGGAGGATYGDLVKSLVGGSGGGIGNSFGAAGGGAIEIGAAHVLTVTGQILADGSPVTSPGGSGGGSGGAILLHGQSINISGTLSVLGGIGGPGSTLYHGYIFAGGNGGGGRIDLLSGTPGAIDITGTIRDGNGSMSSIAATPEPSSLALMAVGLAAAVCLRFRRNGTPR